MTQENKWNYMIAIGCIVAIVFMTYIVLNNANTAVTSNSDSAGQVYNAAANVNNDDSPTKGIVKSYPNTDASETYAYLK